MATTFLTITNQLLREINEPELTSTTFPNAVTIQLYAQDWINHAIRDIIGSEKEWPWNRATTTEVLTPGTGVYTLAANRSVDWDSFFLEPTNEIANGEFTSNITSWTDKSGSGATSAYNSTGNGRLRLTGTGSVDGAAEQAITTKEGRTYTILFRILTNGCTVKIGTESGGTQISSTAITLDQEGEGEIKTIDFVATTKDTTIGFYNTSATVCDVDFVRVREAKQGRLLTYLDFDQWQRLYQKNDEDITGTHWGYPHYVTETANEEYLVSPYPNQANWEVTYDRWTVPDALALHGDNMIFPDHWNWLIVERAKVFALNTLSDPVFYDRMLQQSDKNIEKMRIEEIDRPKIMTAV